MIIVSKLDYWVIHASIRSMVVLLVSPTYLGKPVSQSIDWSVVAVSVNRGSEFR